MPQARASFSASSAPARLFCQHLCKATTLRLDFRCVPNARVMLMPFTRSRPRTTIACVMLFTWLCSPYTAEFAIWSTSAANTGSEEINRPISFRFTSSRATTCINWVATAGNGGKFARAHGAFPAGGSADATTVSSSVFVMTFSFRTRFKPCQTRFNPYRTRSDPYWTRLAGLRNR